MPDEHGIPTDEEIEKWCARWIGENAYRVDDVVRILQEDPEWGAKKIVELPWYTEENGFERWIEQEEKAYAILIGRPILDLRGFVVRELRIEKVWLHAAHLEGMLIESGDLSKADLGSAQIIRADLMFLILVQANFAWANLSCSGFQYATRDLRSRKAD